MIPKCWVVALNWHYIQAIIKYIFQNAQQLKRRKTSYFNRFHIAFVLELQRHYIFKNKKYQIWIHLHKALDMYIFSFSQRVRGPIYIYCIERGFSAFVNVENWIKQIKYTYYTRDTSAIYIYKCACVYIYFFYSFHLIDFTQR